MICLSLVFIKNPVFATRGYTFVIFIFIHALQGKCNILHNILVSAGNGYHTIIDIFKISKKDKSNQRFYLCHPLKNKTKQNYKKKPNSTTVKIYHRWIFVEYQKQNVYKSVLQETEFS